MINTTELDFHGTKLFLSSAPGRASSFMQAGFKDWNNLPVKNLPTLSEVEQDIAKMQKLNVDMVVVLLEKEELYEYPVNLLQEYREADFEVLHFPIEDYWVPESVDAFDELLKKLASAIRFGRNTLIHCRAGMGRTGLVVAGLLIKLGMSADRAIRYVRQKRPGTIESKMQEQFLHNYERRYQYGK